MITLSTVNVTEQSRMDVFKQCGSCIIALVHEYFADMSTSADVNISRGKRRSSVSDDM